MRTPSPTPLVYGVIWFCLLILTGLTTAVAFADLGSFSVAVAIAISCMKAGLIVVFFMHLLRTFNIVRIAAVSGLVWLLILIALTFGDYVTRNWAAK